MNQRCFSLQGSTGRLQRKGSVVLSTNLAEQLWLTAAGRDFLPTCSISFAQPCNKRIMAITLSAPLSYRISCFSACTCSKRKVTEYRHWSILEFYLYINIPRTRLIIRFPPLLLQDVLALWKTAVPRHREMEKLSQSANIFVHRLTSWTATSVRACS